MFNSTNTHPQSLGGQNQAITQRKQAEQNYMNNPKICLFCSNIIPINKEQKICEIRKKKFCNHTCSAKFNNKLKQKKKNFCSICSKPVKRTTKKCNSCYINEKIKDSQKIIKSELFNKCKNWQSARSTIQKMARRIYLQSDKPKKCEICGYDKHYEVCHIKSVSDFDGADTLGMINSIDNLRALCPNHHWEFDNIT